MSINEQAADVLERILTNGLTPGAVESARKVLAALRSQPASDEQKKIPVNLEWTVSSKDGRIFTCKSKEDADWLFSVLHVKWERKFKYNGVNFVFTKEGDSEQLFIDTTP